MQSDEQKFIDIASRGFDVIEAINSNPETVDITAYEGWHYRTNEEDADQNNK